MDVINELRCDKCREVGEQVEQLEYELLQMRKKAKEEEKRMGEEEIEREEFEQKLKEREVKEEEERKKK